MQIRSSGVWEVLGSAVRNKKGSVWHPFVIRCLVLATSGIRSYGGCAACGRCVHAKLCCKNSDKGRLISRDQYEDHRERLRRRMAAEDGREIYKRRKYTVEPRIGHIKHNMGVRRFLRRGMEKVKTEWTMACTAVNLGTLLRHWDEVVITL